MALCPQQEEHKRPDTKGVEECLAPLTMISNESLRYVLLSVPATLGFAGLKVLVPKGKYFC